MKRVAGETDRRNRNTNCFSMINIFSALVIIYSVLCSDMGLYFFNQVHLVQDVNLVTLRILGKCFLNYLLRRLSPETRQSGLLFEIHFCIKLLF